MTKQGNSAMGIGAQTTSGITLPLQHAFWGPSGSNFYFSFTLWGKEQKIQLVFLGELLENVTTLNI